MSESREIKSSQSSVVNTGKAGVRYRQEALEAFYEGFKRRESTSPCIFPTACSTASSN